MELFQNSEKGVAEEMREILFRGFHEDKNGKETIYLDGREIKGEWVEGFLYINSKGEYEISYYSKAFNIERYTYVVIPETVGQYTGLTDKNGKKIFENGYMIIDNKTYKVIFDNAEYILTNIFGCNIITLKNNSIKGAFVDEI